MRYARTGTLSRAGHRLPSGGMAGGCERAMQHDCFGCFPVSIRKKLCPIRGLELTAAAALMPPAGFSLIGGANH